MPRPTRQGRSCTEMQTRARAMSSTSPTSDLPARTSGGLVTSASLTSGFVEARSHVARLRRTVGWMFERFSDTAQRVLVLAEDESRRLGHGQIGTEHLLLGILAEGTTGAP